MTEEHIKSRAISVHNFTRHKCKTLGIPVLLKKVPGIISARLDEEKGKLFLVYDLDRTDYDDIEEVLKLAGCVPDSTLWQQLRSSFIRFAEANQKAHLSARGKTHAYSPMQRMDELLEGEAER